MSLLMCTVRGRPEGCWLTMIKLADGGLYGYLMLVTSLFMHSVGVWYWVYRHFHESHTLDGFGSTGARTYP